MAAITEDAVRELARFRGDSHPVVSCYLDVDGRRFVNRSDVEHQLDHMLRSTRSTQNGERQRAEADLDHIAAFVRSGFDRSRTKGVAMFSSAGGEFWRVLELPVPVRSRIVVNDTPYVRPLELIVSNHEPLGVLLLDKQRARIFLVELGEITERTELFDALPRHEDDGGEWDRDHVKSHVDAAVDHHLQRAADAALGLHEECGFAHLLIGVSDDLWGNLEGRLHPYLVRRFAGRLPVSTTSSAAELLAAVGEAETAIESARQGEVVERLRDTLGRGGRAVARLDPTLEALAERRIDTLLVSRGYEAPGWRCPCGRVARIGPQCELCGSTMHQVDDVVEEIIEDALAQSCTVLICDGNADLDVLGRIGALLRY